VRIRNTVKPHNILLVLDAADRPGYRNVALRFKKVQFDGVILTKMDGDAPRGALLQAVTGKPSNSPAVGRSSTTSTTSIPDRVASRILGMGDVLSLIEGRAHH
jgi:signal recognition particle subunit SRP54